MRTITIGTEKFNVTESTILDVKIAYSYKKNQTSEWICGVDPETMIEIKAIYKSMKDGNNSLYNIFCKILKLN